MNISIIMRQIERKYKFMLAVIGIVGGILIMILGYIGNKDDEKENRN